MSQEKLQYTGPKTVMKIHIPRNESAHLAAWAFIQDMADEAEPSAVNIEQARLRAQVEHNRMVLANAEGDLSEFIETTLLLHQTLTDEY